MASSFQDQLLKAGLADKKQVQIKQKTQTGQNSPNSEKVVENEFENCRSQSTGREAKTRPGTESGTKAGSWKSHNSSNKTT